MPDFSSDFDSGARLYLQMMGIKGEQDQRAMMNRLYESQLQTANLQRQQLIQKMAQDQEQDRRKKLYSESVQPIINRFAVSQTKLPGQDQFVPFPVESVPTDYKDLAKKIVPYAMQYADPKETIDLVEKLQGKTGESFTLGEGQLRFGPSGEVIARGPEKLIKPDKPINMPPWYDSMGMEMLGSRYNTPEGQKEFSDYIATPEGQKTASAYRSKYAQESATPFFMMGQTSEGFVPMNARTGQVGQSTGLGKPLTSEMIVANQQAGTLQETLERVKTLYDPNFVGPIAGRAGGIAQKTIGVDPKKAQFYSDLAQIQNTLIYMLSGKQINESEYNRLKEQLPSKELPASTFEARMKTFEATLSSIIENRKKNMGGYGTNPSSTQPTQTTPNPPSNQPIGSMKKKMYDILDKYPNTPEGNMKAKQEFENLYDPQRIRDFYMNGMQE